jgi:hypothetical protein
MPRDRAGNYHFNSQRAHAADRTAGNATMEMPKMGGMKDMPPHAKKDFGQEGERDGVNKMTPDKESGMSTTLHDHGDGTFHTESADGMREEHPHIGHALMHIAGKHSEGMHHHAHNDGAGITTHHHMGNGGQVSGPHEHESPETAMDHMGKVMNGEEPLADDHESAENSTDMSDGGSLAGAFEGM